MQEFDIANPDYFLRLFTGEKIAEGRDLNSRLVANTKIDEEVKITNTVGGVKGYFIAQILRKQQFENFTVMLQQLGVAKMLPGCHSLEEGLEIYRKLGKNINDIAVAVYLKPKSMII